MNTTLQTVFNFTDEDLEYNRRGELSDHQHTLLKRVRLETIFLYALFLFGICVILFTHIRTGDSIRIATGFVGAAIAIGIILAILYGWNRLEKALSQREVSSVEGVVDLFRAKQYKLAIGNKWFTITSAQFAVLEKGRNYRVYFPSTYNKVVAIEAL